MERTPVAVITGASGGIGSAVAEALSGSGHHVVLADINGDAAEALGASLRAQGGAATALEVDVSVAGSVAGLVSTASRVGRLTALCNIAGVEGSFSPTHEMPIEVFDAVLSINLRGAFLAAREALPHLVDSKGVIVNIASIAGLVGLRDQSPYVASKHGIIGLTRAWALEYARSGVRVNCVCPGQVRTDMMDRVEHSLPPGSRERLEGGSPTGRYSTRSEVAEVVRWLVCGAPSNMTGAVIAVDGGWTAK